MTRIGTATIQPISVRLKIFETKSAIQELVSAFTCYTMIRDLLRQCNDLLLFVELGSEERRSGSEEVLGVLIDKKLTADVITDKDSIDSAACKYLKYASRAEEFTVRHYRQEVAWGYVAACCCC
jgi:hypothetical protein